MNAPLHRSALSTLSRPPARLFTTVRSRRFDPLPMALGAVVLGWVGTAIALVTSFLTAGRF